ncbi:eCIS core domain-containing protein [Streptomyces sp. CA-106131]|uniref:eCIS core domain-containing protein n=1 Tax=Streptomyces sp. CA-106131 TaxID=3240045 RepID=UPI003D8B5B9D
MIAERVLNRLAEQDRAAKEATVTVAPTPAWVAGRAILLIPHRGETPDESALPNDYRKILAIVRAAGNAAVAELAEQGQHVHGAGCGHRQSVQRSSVDQVIRSAGVPLAGPVRQDMDARLGADFGDVRLHTDAAAPAFGRRGGRTGLHLRQPCRHRRGR